MAFTTDASATAGDEQLTTMPHLKCLVRVKTEVPVIKLGYEYVARLIAGLKESSTVAKWTLNTATSGADQIVKYPLPYIKNQLSAVDELLCTSLDLTEINLPVLTKTPQEMYEESVEYVMGIVMPFTNWVDVKLLPSADNYVDWYLPELDPNQKMKHITDEKGSKAYTLAVKFTRRIKQHAYAEPKYLISLIYSGYEGSIMLMKIIIFDPKSLSKTFHQIWKKLGDGVTADEASNSLLLVEMGCIKLRKGASMLVSMIEITEDIAKRYIEMFMRYVSDQKNYVVGNFSKTMHSSIEKQQKNTETFPHNFKLETKTRTENTKSEPSTSVKS